MKSELCPVPKEQIPFKEYQSLLDSVFFKWPTLGKNFLYRKLIYSWLSFMPLILLISYGSTTLRNLPSELILNSFIWSLLAPFLILIRHLLSWNYVYKRLRSEVIEYEESGWYDGQIWDKNIEMREKDILIAQHDLKPVIDTIKGALTTNIIIFAIGLLIINAISFK